MYYTNNKTTEKQTILLTNVEQCFQINEPYRDERTIKRTIERTMKQTIEQTMKRIIDDRRDHGIRNEPYFILYFNILLSSQGFHDHILDVLKLTDCSPRQLHVHD